MQVIVSKWGLNNPLFNKYVTVVINGSGTDARETFRQKQSIDKPEKHAKLLPNLAKLP
jgi:hypothetical protein